MTPVVVRDVSIGEGIPKICVPIVAAVKEEIIREAEYIANIPADVVEWRADWFDDVFHIEEVKETLAQLRPALKNTPILFTFRTRKEGGEKDMEPEAYAALNIAVAQTGNVDLIDVEAFTGAGNVDLIDMETFTGDKNVIDIIAAAHACGVKVVASNHDFKKTPKKDDIVSRLRKMQELGADIPKIAVMPQSKADVLTLLAATEEMYREYADRPVITMSMAGTGVVSRLCGEVFGSALTFGAAGKASAPGQMDVQELAYVLSLLHKSL